MLSKGDLCRIVNTGGPSKDGARFCIVVGCTDYLGTGILHHDYDVLVDGKILRNINEYFLERVHDGTYTG